MTTIARQLRDETVYMLGGLWMIVGLFVDGWSHQANKPDTFFTPWHFLLYSGFGAIVVYSGWIAVRDSRAGLQPVAGDDRITVLGVVLFVIGAVGDGAWHELVGIEVDIEGLISPTHLLLMTGGLLMVTLPVRSALQRSDTEAPLPLLASMCLATGVAGFFLMYLMPWSDVEPFEFGFQPGSEVSELSVDSGMATVIVSSLLFLTPLLWMANRWRLRTATATLSFTALAFGLSGLEGFDVRLPILAATVAGVVVDVLLRQGRRLSVVGLAGGAALWASFFLLLEIESGVGWGPTLWAGAIVFAGLSGLASGAAVRAR